MGEGGLNLGAEFAYLDHQRSIPVKNHRLFLQHRMSCVEVPLDCLIKIDIIVFVEFPCRRRGY